MKTQKEKITYFNKTYHNPRPLDIGTFVLKRNFLHVHFSDKLKPLRFGPFKIINKISDITYEIVNQDGYTSHIHRNHLIPYYPKEPIMFSFLQQNNPHLFNDSHSNINDQIVNPDKTNLVTKINFLPQYLIKKRIYHPQSTYNQNHLANILHFRTNKRNEFLKIPT